MTATTMDVVSHSKNTHTHTNKNTRWQLKSTLKQWTITGEHLARCDTYETSCTEGREMKIESKNRKPSQTNTNRQTTEAAAEQRFRKNKRTPFDHLYCNRIFFSSLVLVLSVTSFILYLSSFCCTLFSLIFLRTGPLCFWSHSRLFDSMFLVFCFEFVFC